MVNDAGCSDSDDDGYLAEGCPSALPADCDDRDVTRHPGARELCGSGTDENCDKTETAIGCMEPNAITEVGGYRVVNGQISALFDSSNGYVISSLALRPPNAETNLLHATGTMEERFIGLHRWQTDFPWDPDAVPTTDEWARGNAVFRLRIRSLAGALTLDSHYTVFPDGRIHRDDQVNVSTTESGRWLTAHASLDPDLYTNLECSYDGTPGSLGSLTSLCTGDSADLTGYSCAYNNTSHVTVGFIHEVPGSPTPDGPRVQESRMPDLPENHSVALIYDWFQNDTVSAGDYQGNFVIWAGAPTDHCDAVDDLRTWLHTPANIMVGGGGSLHTGGASDTDADGWFEGGGFWAIDAGTGSEVSWTIDTNGGSLSPPQRGAFRLHGLSLARPTSGTYTPVVDIDGTPQIHGVDYFWQADEIIGTPGEYVGWLYFGKPLTNGETVRVRVPNGSL